MFCPCVYMMCCNVLCVFMDMVICTLMSIGISMKMHYVFNEMRKWMLTKQNLKKESEFYSFVFAA